MTKPKRDPHHGTELKLIRTIRDLEALDPLLGSKWKEGMLRYYYGRLAELTVRKAGGDPSDVDQVLRVYIELRGLVTTPSA